MVRKMSEHADEVLIAGDDDQAIHRWTSVNVETSLTAQIELRYQSVVLLTTERRGATGISHRIPGRLEKEFFPDRKRAELRGS